MEELEGSPFGGSDGESPEQAKKVDVMANPRAAANAIFENCVLIVLPLWLVVNVKYPENP
jgi:hypothetical protein